jgi:hypothetical protein
MALYPNLDVLMKASQEDFQQIQVGKQKFGQVKAARLYSLLHSEPL